MQSEHQLVANLSDALLKLLQAKGKLEPVSQREQAQLPLGADQHGRSWGGSDNYGLPASSPVPENGTARPDVAGWQACSPSDAPVDELAWSSYHRWSSTVAGSTRPSPSTQPWSDLPHSAPHSRPANGYSQSLPPHPNGAELQGSALSLDPSLSAPLGTGLGWQVAQESRLSPGLGHLPPAELQSAMLGQPQGGGLPSGLSEPWLWSEPPLQVPAAQNGAVRPLPGSAALSLKMQAPASFPASAYGLPLPAAGIAESFEQLKLSQGAHLDQDLFMNGRPNLPYGAAPLQPFLESSWPKAPKNSSRSGKGSKAGTLAVHRKPYSPSGGGVILAAGPAADREALNAALLQLVQDLKPTAAELAARAQAFELVRGILLARWSDSKVHVFGSAANTMSICNNNDIDMTLELPHLPDVPGAKAAIVEEMGRLFLQAGLKDVLPLPKARVPVVKLVAPATGTKIDLTVNNLLAIVNTKLLRDYASIDSRLAQLVFVVKHWAKRRQVNDAYRGTLSSYCYVLMCIHHLQHRQPPILPCLQAMQPPTHIRTVGRWSCDYQDQVQDLAGYGSANRETLADLVWSFFEFWAWRHDFNNTVISVRTLQPVSKVEKEWTKRVGNERHLVSIEDPFELSHDLGRTMDRQTTCVLHKEFERAAGLLRDDPEPLGKLLEPYRVAKYDS